VASAPRSSEVKALRLALAQERARNRRRNALFDRAIRSNDLREVGEELYRYFYHHFGVYKGDITILADYDEREFFELVGYKPRGGLPSHEWLRSTSQRCLETLRGIVEEQVFIGYGAEEERRIRVSCLLEQSMLECMLVKGPRIVNDVTVLSPCEVEQARLQKTRAWLNWPVLHPENGKLLAKLHMSFKSPKSHTKSGLAGDLLPFEDLLRYRILHTRDFRRVRYLSERDALTGFVLRPVLVERLDELLEAGSRSRKGSVLGVGMIDLDLFKRFNDGYGHGVGDRVLKRFAAAVQGVLRVSDVVGRYGGEEFVALFPDTGAADALTILRRVYERIKDVDFIPPSARAGRSKPERLRFSAGIAALTLKPWLELPTFEQVVKAADDLLLEAKSRGRNRCCYRDAAGHIKEYPLGS